MKKFFFVLLCCIDLSTANAQFTKGSFGNFSIGYGSVNLTNLENSFKSINRFGSGFSFTGGTLNFGGGYYTLKRRLLIGGNTSVASITSSGWPGQGVKALTNAGFFNMGYVFINKKQLFAYVLGGAGGGTTTMKVSNTNGSTAILMDNNNSVPQGQSAKFSFANPGFEMAAGFKKMLFASTDKKNKVSGLLLGVDAGYYAIPFKESWSSKITDKKLTGFPKSSAGIWYVRMTLGGGKFLMSR